MDSDRQHPIGIALVVLGFPLLLALYFAVIVLCFPIAVYAWARRRSVSLSLYVATVQVAYVARRQRRWSDERTSFFSRQTYDDRPLNPIRWVDVTSVVYPVMPIDVRVWRRRRSGEWATRSGRWASVRPSGMSRHAGTIPRFERFSERARAVLSMAQEEASSMGHTYVGTEHILLGVAADSDGVALRALTSLGVELEQVRKMMNGVPSASGAGSSEDVSLTPAAKECISLAVSEARARDHSIIRPEHLLIGVVRAADSASVGLLASQGVSPGDVVAEIERLLDQGAG